MKSLHEVPGFHTWKTIEKISRGDSYDEKYAITNKHHEKFLLRITKATDYDLKKRGLMNLVLVDHEVSISRLLEFGNLEYGKYVYALFEWLDGDNVEETIMNYPSSEQYTLGKQAGQTLYDIHKTPIPLNIEKWDLVYASRIKRNLESYTQSTFTLEKAQSLIAYIHENKHLVEDRPNCLLHGDYQLKNMMIQNHHIKIFDFDKIAYGDPWYEFIHIVSIAKESPEFARGMIDGYFKDNVPGTFFKLLKLYIYVELLGSVSRALHFGQEEMDHFLENYRMVCEWYEKSDIPSWYKKM